MEKQIVLEPHILYTLQLKGEDIVLIHSALSKLPYNQVHEAIKSIEEQLKNK
jgi:hypothetical protein